MENKALKQRLESLAQEQLIKYCKLDIPSFIQLIFRLHTFFFFLMNHLHTFIGFNYLKLFPFLAFFTLPS
jgi:hypothetical protein